MMKTCFSLLLLVVLWSCFDPLPPIPESAANAVEKSRDEISDFIMAAPDYDTVREDSMVNDLLNIMLNQPNPWDVESMYAIKSNWSNKYGDEENIQLYAELAYVKLLNDENFSKASRIRLYQGRIYYLEGQLAPSVKNTREAFELARDAGDSTLMGWAMVHLSSSIGHAERLDLATEYSQRGMAIAKATNDLAMEASINISAAILYHRKEQIDSAMSYYQKGLVIAKEQGLEEIEALATSNLSFSLLTSGKPQQAIGLLNEAMVGKSGEVSLTVSMLALTTAEAYTMLKMPDAAYQYIVRGCDVSEQLDIAIGIDACKTLWYQYYEQKGDLEQALLHHKEYLTHALQQTKAAGERNLAVLVAEAKIDERDNKIWELQMSERTKEEAYRVQFYKYTFWGVGSFILAVGIFGYFQFRAKLNLTDQQRIVAEAKLNVLQSQMNPHFIYNALSGIQNFILRSEKIEAFNYLSKFAGLLRIITKSSTEIFIELEREVELLQTYLDLEKLRFREAFSFTLEVDDGLLHENLYVPGMMIQPVVENAIIHGLSGMEKAGELHIKFHRICINGLLCTVTDNGRGREAATRIALSNKHNHLSVATINGNERIESLNSLGYNTAKIEIEDLYDGEEPRGTNVKIYLPFKSE